MMPLKHIHSVKKGSGNKKILVLGIAQKNSEFYGSVYLAQQMLQQPYLKHDVKQGTLKFLKIAVQVQHLCPPPDSRLPYLFVQELPSSSTSVIHQNRLGQIGLTANICAVLRGQIKTSSSCPFFRLMIRYIIETIYIQFQ